MPASPLAEGSIQAGSTLPEMKQEIDFKLEHISFLSKPIRFHSVVTENHLDVRYF